MKISTIEKLLGEMNGQESWGHSSWHQLGEGKLKAGLVSCVGQFSSGTSIPVTSTKGCIWAKARWFLARAGNQLKLQGA